MELVPLIIVLVPLALELDSFSTAASTLVYGNAAFGTGSVTLVLDLIPLVLKENICLLTLEPFVYINGAFGAGTVTGFVS